MPMQPADVAEFLDPEEVAAIRTLRFDLGLDVLRTYQFHETLIARLLGGSLTAYRCPWDIEVEGIRVEVKSASEFRSLTDRQCRFKFGLPSGRGPAPKAAHVTVFSGIDLDDGLWSWVIPARLLWKHPPAVTITSPRTRLGGYSRNRSKIASRLVPYDQILPQVVDCYFDEPEFGMVLF